ncbi:MAG: hypothetical protein O7H41_20480 [Planctomycetota bacterium]|nr:hypothetical protein [Planctomycetota bacterium]
MPLPGPSYAITAVSDDVFVYAVGRFGAPQDEYAVDIYDPSTDTWTMGPQTPFPCVNSSGSAILGAELFVLACPLDGRIPYLYSYDTIAGQWSLRATKHNSASGVGVAASGTSLYVFGGRLKS